MLVAIANLKNYERGVVTPKGLSFLSELSSCGALILRSSHLAELSSCGVLTSELSLAELSSCGSVPDSNTNSEVN